MLRPAELRLERRYRILHHKLHVGEIFNLSPNAASNPHENSWNVLMFPCFHHVFPMFFWQNPNGFRPHQSNRAPETCPFPVSLMRRGARESRQRLPAATNSASSGFHGEEVGYLTTGYHAYPLVFIIIWYLLSDSFFFVDYGCYLT